jgi:hypothetical protein
MEQILLIEGGFGTTAFLAERDHLMLARDPIIGQPLATHTVRKKGAEIADQARFGGTTQRLDRHQLPFTGFAIAQRILVFPGKPEIAPELCIVRLLDDLDLPVSRNKRSLASSSVRY